MSKQVQVKQEIPVALSNTEWGVTETMSAKDTVIAQILMMQGLSELVADGKAVMGEARDSLTGALISKKDESFEVVPFHVAKFWDLYKDNGKGGFDWVRTEPIIENPKAHGYNDNKEWREKIEGVEHKNVRRFNFFVLIPSQIAEGTSVPYVLSFKSTSFTEGKKLYTQMYMRNTRAGLAPCAYVMNIKGERRENEQGKFYVPTVQVGRQATAEEGQEALNWFKLMKTTSYKVDEPTDTVSSDETGEF